MYTECIISIHSNILFETNVKLQNYGKSFFHVEPYLTFETRRETYTYWSKLEKTATRGRFPFMIVFIL